MPEKTQQTIEDGWLRTGDLVKVDEDGYYYYLGRVDDMITTGGENVYPAEIEEFLLTCPGVNDCVVVGLPDAARRRARSIDGHDRTARRCVSKAEARVWSRRLPACRSR